MRRVWDAASAVARARVGGGPASPAERQRRACCIFVFEIECQTTSTRRMAPAGSARRIFDALGINSGRAKSRRLGAPLEMQPGFLMHTAATRDRAALAGVRPTSRPPPRGPDVGPRPRPTRDTRWAGTATAQPQVARCATVRPRRGHSHDRVTGRSAAVGSAAGRSGSRGAEKCTGRRAAAGRTGPRGRGCRAAETRQKRKRTQRHLV
eukprot:6741132-Prymnesium_polylepis.1